MSKTKDKAVKKVKVDATVRVNAYNILSSAIGDAVERGYRRAHKHTDKPEQDGIVGNIYNEVMSAISDILMFE